MQSNLEIRECRALLIRYLPLLIAYRALFILLEYRALLEEYGDFLKEYRAFLMGFDKINVSCYICGADAQQS